MSELLETLRFDIERRLKYICSRGIKLAIACSGGKDSMAMCEYFLKMKTKHPSLDLSVLHVNFGLRSAESDLDEDFIRDWCSQNHLKFLVKSVDGSKQLGGIQQWARDIRYQWFKDWCDKNNGIVCVAHHIQDQSETTLFKLARGSEVDKLGSMSVYSDRNKVWRPFLRLDFKQIEILLDGKKIPHREDSSNVTIKYSRNRIRHNVLPELELISSGAEHKIANAAREISELYSYVIDSNATLIRAENLSFDDIGMMPQGIAKVILGKFIKDKIVGYKLKSSSISLLYDALLKEESVDLTLDSVRLARCSEGRLSVIKASKPFDARRRQHERHFFLDEVDNHISEDCDLEIDP